MSESRDHARGAVELLAGPGTTRAGDPEATPAPAPEPHPGAGPGPGAGVGTGATSGRHVALGAVAFGLSLGVWALWAWLRRDVMWQALDLSVYEGAARSLAGGSDRLYDGTFGTWSLPFVYPPFAALCFAAVPLGFDGLRGAMAGASVVSLVLVVWCAWGMLGLRWAVGRLAATLAVSAVALWLEPVAWTLMWGQVNLVLLAVVMVDLARPDSRRTKGMGIGLAAGFKLIPLAFVAYLVVTRRYRAAVVAGAAFTATVVLGWLVAPASSQRYWSDLGAIPGRVSHEVSIATLNNQSVLGALNRLSTNGAGVTVVWFVVAAAVLAVGLLSAARASRQGHELLAVVVVGAVTLFLSPISWSHHWVWVVPALVLLVDRAARTGRRAWWWAATAAAVAYGAWPLSLDADGRWDPSVPLQPFGLIWLAPRDGQRERHWNLAESLVGNGYLLIGLTVAAAVAWHLPGSPAPRPSRQP